MGNVHEITTFSDPGAVRDLTGAGVFSTGDVSLDSEILGVEVTDGGTISGRSLDTNGLGRPGACVYAYFASDDRLAGTKATTDSTGHYSLLNLAPGTYKVGFAPSCAMGQPPVTHWNGEATSLPAAPPVYVGAGSDVIGIDAML